MKKKSYIVQINSPIIRAFDWLFDIIDLIDHD